MEERRKILELVERGEISVDEAKQLLTQLGEE